MEIEEVEFEIDARSDALDIFIQQSYSVNESYLINREAECVTTGGMIRPSCIKLCHSRSAKCNSVNLLSNVADSFSLIMQSKFFYTKAIRRPRQVLLQY